jgi:hypothetical protein
MVEKCCDRPQFVKPFLDLHIRHVPQSGVLWLRKQLDDKPGKRAIVVLEDQEVGYWIHAPRLEYDLVDKIASDCPLAVVLMINFANQHNCDWIRLSTEGYVTSALPEWPE